jgi:hypothetical protein
MLPLSFERLSLRENHFPLNCRNYIRKPRGSSPTLGLDTRINEGYTRIAWR